MKHRFTFYLTYALVVLLGMLGVLLLLLGEKAPRPSEEENRTLAGFPAFSFKGIADGSYMRGIEDYLSDGMPARGRIVSKTAAALGALSLQSKDEEADANAFEAVEAFGNDGVEDGEPEQIPATSAPNEEVVAPVGTPTSNPTLPPAPQSTETPAPSDPPAAETPASAPTATPKVPVEIKTCKFRQLRADGTVREPYTFETSEINNAISVLNAFRDALPEDGHVFFSQIPFPEIAFGLQNGKYVGWECALEEMLDTNTKDGVIVVSTLDVLEQPLLNGEDLYFTTDHHWKPRAACYLAQEMLKRIGITALSYEDYTYNRNSGFYGSKVNGNPELKETLPPDTVEVMIPALPVKGYVVKWNGSESSCAFMVTDRASYRAYLNGTVGPWRRYETGVDCGRKALVIGDSYICCFVPYLTPYYEEVHTTDLRKDYYDASHRTWSIQEYIRKNGIDDVYLILSTASGLNSEYLKTYLKKYF